MKNKDLIEQLQKLDPEMPVVMSRDSEGNGFSPVCDVELSWQDGDGEAYADEDYEEYKDELTRAIVIWTR